MLFECLPNAEKNCESMPPRVAVLLGVSIVVETVL